MKNLLPLDSRKSNDASSPTTLWCALVTSFWVSCKTSSVSKRRKNASTTSYHVQIVLSPNDSSSGSSDTELNCYSFTCFSSSSRYYALTLIPAASLDPVVSSTSRIVYMHPRKYFWLLPVNKLSVVCNLSILCLIRLIPTTSYSHCFLSLFFSRYVQ